MGPPIILDKSTIQSLSFNEMTVLRRHFTVVIVPVIAIEILADLKKKKLQRLPEKVVQDLANKLMPSQSLVNISRSIILEANLLGHEIGMSFRPVTNHGRNVEDIDGTTGVVIPQSEVEQAIQRWQKGEFTQAEEVLASEWRHRTKYTDLERFRKILASKAAPDFPIKIPAELRTYVNALLEADPAGQDLIQATNAWAGLDSTVVSKIWMRWMHMRKPPLRDFAPYAYYFAKTIFTFDTALAVGLIGTRATNIIDLEYLFYLPFCKVFSSKDKFHQTLAPALLEDTQIFVPGNELKQDLQKLYTVWSQLPANEQDEQLRKYGSQPTNIDSLIYRIWKQCHPDWTLKELNPLEMSEEEGQKVVERIKRLQNAPEHTGSGENESDFMIIERPTRWLDPCFCGSGRSFGDCHGRLLQND